MQKPNLISDFTESVISVRKCHKDIARIVLMELQRVQLNCNNGVLTTPTTMTTSMITTASNMLLLNSVCFSDVSVSQRLLIDPLLASVLSHVMCVMCYPLHLSLFVHVLLSMPFLFKLHHTFIYKSVFSFLVVVVLVRV